MNSAAANNQEEALLSTLKTYFSVICFNSAVSVFKKILSGGVLNESLFKREM
jgi:hypothetical protein